MTPEQKSRQQIEWQLEQAGWIVQDCRLTTREGEVAVEWTWGGNDEMDPAQGRGWSILQFR